MSPRTPSKAPDLGTRFARHVEEERLIHSGDKVVVALSGGVDSTVLLHLLRYHSVDRGLTLLAAHFDHRMRAGSGDDLQWVRGLCRAWNVDLRTGAPVQPLNSEEEAREERYTFLLQVMAEENATVMVTGHHADDQVETVLFRILRGTGLRGLAGIPDSRSPGLSRPLLPFSRDELLAYARENRVSYRTDPTNLDTAYSRNFLRHEVLPLLDGGPIPGARAALLRLSRLARENEEAWDSLLPGLLEGVCRVEEGGVFIVLSGLRAYHPALQNRLLREILLRSGIDLDEAGTRAALEFTRSGVSGGSYSLPGGFRLIREFEVLRLHRAGETDRAESSALVLSGPEDGSGLLSLDGKGFHVMWGAVRPDGSNDLVEAPRGVLEFPLRLRQWMPGDRIQLPYGTKKLKKLFGEARIPVEQRLRIPILLDARNRVLWVAGLASSVLMAASVETDAFFVGIRNVDQS
jgi:tRNA(Ile)-lysidine synthase